MSKTEKTVPAAPGNPAVRIWPTEVNASGVVVPSISGPAYKHPEKKNKASVELSFALIRPADGRIAMLIGGTYRSKDGLGGGGNAPSITGKHYYTIPEAVDAMLGYYFERAGIVKDRAEIIHDLRAEVQATQGPDHEAVAALGLDAYEEFSGWVLSDKQPAGAEAPKPRVLSRAKRQCRWKFTHEEKIEISQRQGEANMKVLELEESKKRAMSQFKTDIENAAGQRDELAKKATSGYEFRDLPCSCYADTPRPGMKQWRRDDTGEVVDETYMTGADVQQTLPGIDDAKPDPADFENDAFEDEDGDND